MGRPIVKKKILNIQSNTNTQKMKIKTKKLIINKRSKKDTKWIKEAHGAIASRISLLHKEIQRQSGVIQRDFTHQLVPILGAIRKGDISTEVQKDVKETKPHYVRNHHQDITNHLNPIMEGLKSWGNSTEVETLFNDENAIKSNVAVDPNATLIHQSISDAIKDIKATLKYSLTDTFKDSFAIANKENPFMDLIFSEIVIAEITHTLDNAMTQAVIRAIKSTQTAL